MPCCCNNILNICTPVSACDPWVLRNALSSLSEGNYVGVLDFLGNSKPFDITVADGEVFFDNMLSLNEKYTYRLKLYSVGEDSEKTPVSVTVDEVVYDCIQFSTSL